jgi:MFS transporter, DHA3 family, macrolide efflux protein
MRNRQAIIQLFIANIISGIAQGITMIAIPWYFVKTGNMATFGMIYMLSNCISLFWSPYAGTLIDKYNRKNIFLYICLTVGSLELLICGLGFYTGGLNLLAIGAVFVLTSLNFNIHYTNLYAFSQEIVENKFFKKITSYLEIAGQIATMVSGAAAAFLLEGTQGKIRYINISAWTIEEIFLFDAFTYFVAFAIIYFIRYEPIMSRESETGNIWQRIKFGFDYLQKQPNMLWFGILSLNTFATMMVFVFIGSGMYVRYNLNGGGDIYAIGAAFAGIAIQRIFNRMSVPKSIIIMTWATVLLYAVMYFFADTMLYLSMIFILGLTNAGTRVQRVVYIFQQVPNQIFGRVNSAFALVNGITRIILIFISSLPLFLNENVNNILLVFMLLLSVTAIFLTKMNTEKIS